MNATMMVCAEVVETIPVDCRNEPTPRPLLTAPTVEFITKREHGFSLEQTARWRSGRNIRTGKLHLGVSLRRRNNGMTRIDADLWRLPYDLNQHAIEQLQSHWRLLNEATPAKAQARMQQHFSRTFLQFDTMAEQAHEWCEFLKAMLSDASSYVAIGRSMPQHRAHRS